ncbi:nuclear mitotic apparatus protein 1-like [Symsagittifera roscoffensis]|uniref:nuclear mitotic apparatus protein 1-like n=1 Tax=Symsagittifera roscoffensis TaxID=84072 RepID=UPI00307BBCC2
MEALEKTHLVEVDKLRLQINTLTDEKQIVQESLEIENMNLTDQLLQATGQMEVLAAQRDSLQAEKGQLVQNCEQARHDYNTLTAHNSTLEEDLKKAHGAMERLHEKLEQVSSYGADDRRTSEEQIAELQLKVAELEEKAAESEDLRGIIATMEKKLASSDNTLKSYKKLYMDEKARSQQSQHHLARSHTYSPDRGVSQKENVLPMLSHRIKQEATVTGGDVHYERPVTRQVVSTSNLNDRFETLPARSRVPLSGSSSTTFSTPSMKLRSRVMASQNFADSVPNEESLYKFSDVLDMIHPDMASVQTRMSDLQRQENVLPKSLLTLSSYPTDTITSSSQSTVAQASTSSLHSAENNVMSGLRNRQHPPNSHLRNNLNWTSTSSSSSSSSLLSGSGTSTGSETLARTVPHINLPGYVPSREMRGLSGQTLDSSGKRSSMMWISANQGPGEARGHGQDEDEDEGLNSEDRMSEIERRNSMYPRHLQSCYPMENLTDSTGSATRAAASGGRKRPMHLTSSMDMCEDDNLNSTGVENNPPSGSTGTAPRGAKQVKRGNVLPDRMNHPPLSGSDCLFSPEARMTASPFRSCLPPSVKKLKKGHTPLTMPSPQKLVQRVTKGRRSKVGPMDTVPEKSSGSKQDQQSSSASASSGDGATGGGDKSGTGGSVFMEFPNTPKDKKRKKKSGLLG